MLSAIGQQNGLMIPPFDHDFFTLKFSNTVSTDQVPQLAPMAFCEAREDTAKCTLSDNSIKQTESTVQRLK